MIAVRDDADDLLAEWVAEIAARRQRGEAVDLSAYETQASELAGELRALLPTIEMMAALPQGQAVPPAQRGDFELVREIGRGGMGVVYEAVQRSLRRRVAFKALLPQPDPAARSLRRFQLEAQAAGALNHPHIVPVHAYGSDDAGPFYIMPLIDGRDGARIVSELIERRQSATGPTGSPAPTGPAHARFVAMLAVHAAEALAHAHARGVLHRDIKPSNLLVDSNDHLWITDFGLARISAGVTHTLTESGGFVGTWRYASPEQLLGRRAEVDGRTDIYALGVTLYELLTLRPPFAANDPLELMRQIAGDPVRPRRIDPAIPAELETIVLKAMARAPRDRYASADDLADDLRRFLTGQPIEARPPSLLSHAWRWAVRHQTLSVSGTVGAVAAGLLALALPQADRVPAGPRATESASAAEALAAFQQRASAVLGVQQAARLLKNDQVDAARKALRTVAAGPGRFDPDDFAWRYLRKQAEQALVRTGSDDDRANATLGQTQDGLLISLARHGRGRLDGPVRLLDPYTFATRATFGPDDAGTSAVWSASPDGRLVGCIRCSEAPPKWQKAQIWDVATGRLRVERALQPEDWAGLLFLAGDRYLLESGTGPPPAWWNGTRELWALPNEGEPTRLAIFGKPARDRWPSRDGRMLAISELVDPQCRLVFVDVRTGKTDGMPPAIPTKKPVDQCGFSRDGTVVAGSIYCGEHVFWELATGKVLARRELPRLVEAQSVIFSPDGLTAAILDETNEGTESIGTAEWWRRDTGETHGIPFGTQTGRKNFRMAFSPDGARLAFAYESKQGGQPVTLWDAATGRKLATTPDALIGVLSLQFTPDGSAVIINNANISSLWRPDLGAPEKLPGHSDEAWGLAFSSDSRVLASGCDDKGPGNPQTIKLWDVPSGQFVRSWNAGPGTVATLAFSPDGQVLASAHLTGTDNVRLWEAATGKLLASLPGHAGQARGVAFHPGGRLLASAGADAKICLWDVAAHALVRRLEGHAKKVHAVAFSADGSTLASASNDGSVRLWDVATGESRAILVGEPVMDIAFESDGRTLAAADRAGQVTLWDTATGTRRAVLYGDGDPLLTLAFTRDGHALACAGHGGTIRFWDVPTGRPLYDLPPHAAQVNRVAFAPDGATLASSSHDGAVWLWRADVR